MREGFEAEMLAKFIFQQVCDTACPWSTKAMLSALENTEYGRERLRRVRHGLAKESRTLETLSRDEFLDYALGVDFVIEIVDKGVVSRWAVDVTINKTDVDKKKTHLRNMQPILEGLGCAHALVLVLSSEGRYADMVWEELDQDRILDAVYGIVEVTPKTWVRQVSLVI